MKEKMKKMFQYIGTWKFVMWLNVGCTAYHVVALLVTGQPIFCAAVAWHAGFAMMAFFLQKYDERHTEDAFYVVHMFYRNVELQHQLDRYKARYGELPTDAPEPSAVSKKPKNMNRKPRVKKLKKEEKI